MHKSILWTRKKHMNMKVVKLNKLQWQIEMKHLEMWKKKKHHWLLSKSTSGVLEHFASFAVPPDSNPAGFKTISEDTFTARLLN